MEEILNRFENNDKILHDFMIDIKRQFYKLKDRCNKQLQSNINEPNVTNLGIFNTTTPRKMQFESKKPQWHDEKLFKNNISYIKDK